MGKFPKSNKGNMLKRLIEHQVGSKKKLPQYYD